MPAPIAVLTPPGVDSHASGRPVPKADVDAVSFEAVLAAQLGEQAGLDPSVVPILSAARDAPAPDDSATTSSDAPSDPLAETLQASVAVALPAMQAPMSVAPAPVAPPTLDEPLPPAAGLAQPDIGAPRAQVRIEAAGAAVPADPVAELPEPARFAAQPADTTAQPVALPSSPRLAAAEPAATADPVPVHGQAPDPALVIPVGPERTENSARTAPQPLRLDIAAPLSSRDFGPEVGNRLVWMATQNHQVAELRIDPPQLGPVEVRLSIANDQANLSIVSPHAAVREAMQASLPRLQDMLQGLGISLGHVSVGAEGFGQGALGQGWTQTSEHRLPGPAYVLRDYPQGLAAAALVPLRAGAGVIDVYA